MAGAKQAAGGPTAGDGCNCGRSGETRPHSTKKERGERGPAHEGMGSGDGPKGKRRKGNQLATYSGATGQHQVGRQNSRARIARAKTGLRTDDSIHRGSLDTHGLLVAR